MAELLPGAAPLREMYSYLYRGASGFVHATPAGIEPTFTQVPGAFQLDVPRSQPRRVLEVVCAAVSLLVGIAQVGAPWLVEDLER